ncbi:DUF2510 domain-containing protein [Rhodococcus pyridinivorans]|uniref:DUF2510 domain-containing protein n=1 Tax=Rhodococcus pyridinivorans TaxID=103816 RepID=UPI001FFE75C5|nr:DUF2510 domain-containing protein [Rhodococcus pyridinivorans]UPK63148.1 DUF2510 domain-containing protein [Rhodococcus pyridinivorans]
MTAPEPKKRKWPIVVGVIVAAFVALAVLGAIVGPQDEESESTAAASSEPAPTTTETTTTTTTTEPTTTTAAPTTTTTTEVTTTTTTVAPPPPAAAPAAQMSDPRCAPADPAMVEWITAGLTDTSLKLDNAVVIEDDGLLFVGASTVRPDGKFENRSDVWVVRDSLPFSSTGGARSATSWAKASDELGISPGDERVQAVDTCVVDLTRN